MVKRTVVFSGLQGSTVQVCSYFLDLFCLSDDVRLVEEDIFIDYEDVFR